MENTILYSQNQDATSILDIGIGSTDCDPQDPEPYLLPEDRTLGGREHS